MGGTQQSKLTEVTQVENLSFLDEGDFAKLYKGYLTTANRMPITIKVPKVPENIRKEKKLVKTHIEEVKKLVPHIKRAKSEYVVKYLGVSYDDFRKEVWVMREFVDGTDLETMMKNPSLCPALRSPERRMAISVGVAKGIAHLHNLRNPILHGDFKPSDILIPAKTLQPKITNFGLWDFKKFFIENTHPEDVIFFNPCQAPEVLVGQERPTLFSDIWSVSAAILQWLLEFPPWNLQDLCARYRYRENRQYFALQEAMNSQEDPCIIRRIFEGEDQDLDFFREAFSYQPTERPSINTIEQKLVQLSLTPTWTNVAYKKYYG